jgi:hypothetical protein
MTIPSTILDKWRTLRSHGDAQKILEAADAAGVQVSIDTVYRALSSGKCSPELLQVIGDFFKEKENMLYEYS